MTLLTFQTFRSVIAIIRTTYCTLKHDPTAIVELQTGVVEYVRVVVLKARDV